MSKSCASDLLVKKSSESLTSDDGVKVIGSKFASSNSWHGFLDHLFVYKVVQLIENSRYVFTFVFEHQYECFNLAIN